MNRMLDPIPLEKDFQFRGPDADGQCSALFYAFNTVVTLQAFAEEASCLQAFAAAMEACRRFERLFSRTLPHSDISRLNAADGAWVDVSRETFELLAASKRYCAESSGIFDITMGAAVRLWDFHRGIVPRQAELEEALKHVDWRFVELKEKERQCEGAGKSPVEETQPAGRGADAALSTGQAADDASPCETAEHEPAKSDDAEIRYCGRLADSAASVDVGGTAKGFIADAIGDIFLAKGVESFIVNLGGNVLANGVKPDKNPWIIGLQDPRASRESGKILGAIPLENASAVTSGTYERCFERDGKTYHHILDPATGFPVKTDLAGATVIARTSLDAEGYSTTLLALGKERAAAFAQNHPAILAAYLVDAEGRVFVATR
ncbi:MAG: FAD:protein FMN transferase [Slackia sp.]|nr:FAD:protein FMN transferase [Slackia sp.]